MTNFFRILGDELGELEDNINRVYPLRQTRERNERQIIVAQTDQTQKKKKKKKKKKSNTVTSAQPEESTEEVSSDLEFDFDEMASSVPILNKFVGHITDPNDPDKSKLEAYTVHQFIADVEARISAKKLTTDADKIKEAHLLISSDKGDAHSLVLSPAFEGVTFDAFKELCILSWEREEYKDPFNNLLQFRNVKLTGTETTFLTDLITHGARIKADILANAQFPKAEVDNNNEYILIQHAIDYFAHGLIYANFPEEYRNALKENPIDPTIGLIKTLSNVRTNVVKKRTKLESETTLLTKHKEKKTNEQSKNKNVGNSQSMNSSKDKSSQGQQYYNQGQYQNNQGYNYQNQGSRGNFRGQSNYRGRGRGRGYDRKPGNIVCYRCGRPNHTANVCNRCTYCYAYGHYNADCYKKQRDEGRKSHSDNRNEKPTHSQSQ